MQNIRGSIIFWIYFSVVVSCYFLPQRVRRCIVMVNGRKWSQHETSLLVHQSIVMLLGFSCAQQVHLGKATSTTAKNLLFLSALVVIISITAQRKKTSSCVLAKGLSKKFTCDCPVTTNFSSLSKFQICAKKIPKKQTGTSSQGRSARPAAILVDGVSCFKNEACHWMSSNCLFVIS